MSVCERERSNKDEKCVVCVAAVRGITENHHRGAERCKAEMKARR